MTDETTLTKYQEFKKKKKKKKKKQPMNRLKKYPLIFRNHYKSIKQIDLFDIKKKTGQSYQNNISKYI
jgi:hypothetical protein